MIEFKYADVINPMFFGLMGKIFNATGLRVKAAYTIAKIAPKIERERALALDLRMKLLKQYGQTDEKGDLKFDQNSGVIEIKPEMKGTFEKEFSEFLGQTFQLPYTKMSLHDLEVLKLSPAEILMLEPMLEMEDMEEDQEVALTSPEMPASIADKEAKAS